MTHAEWIDLARLVLEALGAISTVAALLFGWMHWSLKREMVTKAELAVFKAEHDEIHEILTKRLAEGERQFDLIQADIEHLPDRKDIEALNSRIGMVEGSIRELTAMVGGLKDVLKRVETPLNLLVANHLKGGS